MSSKASETAQDKMPLELWTKSFELLLASSALVVTRQNNAMVYQERNFINWVSSQLTKPSSKPMHMIIKRTGPVQVVCCSDELAPTLFVPTFSLTATEFNTLRPGAIISISNIHIDPQAKKATQATAAITGVYTLSAASAKAYLDRVAAHAITRKISLEVVVKICRPTTFCWQLAVDATSALAQSGAVVRVVDHLNMTHEEGQKVLAITHCGDQLAESRLKMIRTEMRMLSKVLQIDGERLIEIGLAELKDFMVAVQTRAKEEVEGGGKHTADLAALGLAAGISLCSLENTTLWNSSNPNKQCGISYCPVTPYKHNDQMSREDVESLQDTFEKLQVHPNLANTAIFLAMLVHKLQENDSDVTHDELKRLYGLFSLIKHSLGGLGLSEGHIENLQEVLSDCATNNAILTEEEMHDFDGEVNPAVLCRLELLGYRAPIIAVYPTGDGVGSTIYTAPLDGIFYERDFSYDSLDD